MDHFFWKPEESPVIRYWQAALGHLLGWSPSEVLEWAVRWESWIDESDEGRDASFCHENLEWYIVPLLIPSELRERLDVGELTQLQTDLEFAIPDRDMDGRLTAPPTPQGWSESRQRVNDVLGQYGASLPAVTP